MPLVQVQVPHQLTREIAILRLQEYGQRMRGEHGAKVADLEEIWQDGIAQFSFRALGFSVSGQTIVNDESAEIHVRLPLAAIPFRGLIEKEIAERLGQALS